MAKKIYETPEGRYELGRLIRVLRARKESLEKQILPIRKMEDINAAFAAGSLIHEFILEKIASGDARFKNPKVSGTQRIRNSWTNAHVRISNEEDEYYSLLKQKIRNCAKNLKKNIKESLRADYELDEDISDEDNDVVFNKIRKYQTVERGIDFENIPYKVIICPLSENALIKKFDSFFGWECQTYMTENENCRKCQYKPE